MSNNLRIVERERFDGTLSYQVQIGLDDGSHELMWKSVFTGTLDECRKVKQERIERQFKAERVVE
jgi:hypothetical protein